METLNKLGPGVYEHVETGLTITKVQRSMPGSQPWTEWEIEPTTDQLGAHWVATVLSLREARKVIDYVTSLMKGAQ